MSDTSSTNGQGDGAEPAAAGTAAAAAQPSIHVLGQYIKDLSFENPGAPGSLKPGEANPQIEVNVGVNAKTAADANYEVELKLEAKAQRGSDTLFLAEVTYAGLFQVRSVPQEHLHPMLFIECPRLLFPFARQILADATRNGGFPPLMIDPVDFVSLYRQKMAQIAARQTGAGSSPA